MQNFITNRKVSGQYNGYCWQRTYSERKRIMTVLKLFVRILRLAFEACKICVQIAGIVRFFLP